MDGFKSVVCDRILKRLRHWSIRLILTTNHLRSQISNSLIRDTKQDVWRLPAFLPQALMTKWETFAIIPENSQYVSTGYLSKDIKTPVRNSWSNCCHENVTRSQDRPVVWQIVRSWKLAHTFSNIKSSSEGEIKLNTVCRFFVVGIEEIAFLYTYLSRLVS